MDEKRCFFIGSRFASYKIKDQLAQAVEKHITEYGVNVFTVGNYGNFDRLVKSVLKDKKKQYPKIKLYLLAPYALSQKIEIPDGFDGTIYPEGLERGQNYMLLPMLTVI